MRVKIRAAGQPRFDLPDGLAQIDKTTGKIVWSQRGVQESWGTPVLVKVSVDKYELVLSSKGEIQGYDPDTGKPLWRAPGIDDYVCPSVIAHDGIVFAIGGRKGMGVAVQAGLNWRTAKGDARLGFAHFNDRLQDGSQARSDVIEASVSRRFLDNKLEISAATSFAIGKSESVDLPERHRFSARYALSNAVRLVGTYEIAHGDTVDARTGRIGVEVAPWSGGRVTGMLGQQQISEYGKRSFAAFGLSQSIPVTKNLTLDATLDSNRTLSGFNLANLVNPAHPASSGGNLGENGTLAEDFTAVTMGGTWRAGLWSATLRGEWRHGDLENRTGVTFGAIRQLGDGSMVGTGATWTRVP